MKWNNSSNSMPGNDHGPYLIKITAWFHLKDEYCCVPPTEIDPYGCAVAIEALAILRNISYDRLDKYDLKTCIILDIEIECSEECQSDKEINRNNYTEFLKEKELQFDIGDIKEWIDTSLIEEDDRI